MPIADAPLRAAGHVVADAGLLSTWGGGLDTLEHVPDLRWPESVRTYARMRHDPTLASVISAYTLPIRQTRWEIDPRGAAPDVTRLCADSLGLPLKGVDKPGPVRRRGVHWLDHLQTALSSIVFGHACFEPIYQIVDGQALLAALPDRPQTTIAEITVDRQGDLESVSQYGDSTDPNPPPLQASRLLWYVRQREGANWAGTSVLRPAFGAWLLKQDALRTHATSLRRFGAGTPVVEWDPGTNPTEAQQQAAQRVAASIRVSDSGSAQMPPGAHLRIRGVEGSFPDSLPFLRYLDEQMARAALTSMLDLSSTPNGSRALGDKFYELLAQAMQATADALAETATELCVRLTNFNAGEDAPAPAVVAGDLTIDEMTLAESVSRLIQAGAVEPDDDLEEWLRDVHHAPKKGTPRVKPAPAQLQPPQDQQDGQQDPQDAPDGGPPEPPPGDTKPTPPKPQTAAARGGIVGLGTVTIGDGKPEVVIPLRDARRITAADPIDPATGQPLPVGNRPLTPEEEAAGVDPAEQKSAADEVLAALLVAWLLIRRDQDKELLDRIREASGPAAVAAVTVDTGDAADVLGAAMLEAVDHGIRLATAEAAHQGVDIPTPDVDVNSVQERATALAAVLGQARATGAAREALRLWGDGATPDEVAAGVAAYLDGLADSTVNDQLAGAVQVGIGQGRAAVYEAGPKAAYYASEILDGATCRQHGPDDPLPRCWEIDKKRYDNLADALRDYPAGIYRNCRGRWRCRGMLVALYDHEASA